MTSSGRVAILRVLMERVRPQHSRVSMSQGDRDLNLVRELDPQLQTFRDWLAEHKIAIPLG